MLGTVDFVFEEDAGQSTAGRLSHGEMTLTTGQRTDRRDQPAFTSKAQRRSEGTRAALEVRPNMTQLYQTLVRKSVPF
jgi:hypothetical protein